MKKQIQISSTLHSLIHVLIDIEKGIQKIKVLIDEMIKEDTNDTK